MIISVLLICCNSNEPVPDVNLKKYNLSASANDKSDSASKLEFTGSPNFDFGTIKVGDKVSRAFYFKNVGGSPLVIESVITPCGCTVANFNKQAIAPNKTDSIVTVFTAYSEMLGTQNKTITVNFNSPSSPKLLTLYGKVVE